MLADRLLRASGVTIDGPKSIDLDDAIRVERREDGGWVVTVSIAAVADFVEAGSQLDLRARKAAATVYAGPRIRRPMLPYPLTRQLSLTPQGGATCMAIWIVLTPELELRNVAVERALFTSQARLAYDDVASLLTRRTDHSDPVQRMLVDALALAQRLYQRRHQLGAVLDTDPDAPDGEVNITHPGHLIVSELMILGNAAASWYARKNNLPLLFRNHWSAGVDPILARHRDELRLNVTELPVPFHLLERARYDAVCVGHLGPALQGYTHVTSPLRRYPDMVNQRILLGLPQPDVELLGEELTERLWSLRDQRVESFRAPILSIARESLNKGRVLDATEFRQYLKASLEQVGRGGPLDDMILDRLAELPQVELARILAYAPPGCALLAPLIERISSKPEEAPSIANILGAKFGVLVTLTVGPRPTGYESSVQLEGEDRTVAAQAHRRSRADAIQAAFAIALARWANVPPPLVEREDAGTVHPRSVLNEIAQQRGWPAPVFDSQAVGTPQVPRFRCEALMEIGAELARASGEAGTVRDAVRAAAAALLNHVQPALEP